MLLSLLIPAYNEAGRLPGYLRTIQAYAERSVALEVIVVDDGSTDGMSTLLHEWSAGWPQLRVVRHEHNQGRGQAIRTGMAAVCGDLVLYADADGATPIEQEHKLRAAITDGADVAVGSRLVASDGVSRHRTRGRGIIGRTFGKLVKILVGVPVRDTQCGFKMWRREVGQEILALCKDKQWLLDVEFLAFAQRLGYRVAEVPVTWSEVPGSKVHLVRDSWRMFRGLWTIRRSLKNWESEGPQATIPKPMGRHELSDKLGLSAKEAV